MCLRQAFPIDLAELYKFHIFDEIVYISQHVFNGKVFNV